MSDTGALIYVVDHDVSARECVAGLIRSAGPANRPWPEHQAVNGSAELEVTELVALLHVPSLFHARVY
jgi:FixJ family two-component response regulator